MGLIVRVPVRSGCGELGTTGGVLGVKWQMIALGEDFKLGQAACPKLPFVLGSDGIPHYQLNRYIRYRALTERRNIASTITETVRQIVRYLNYLASGAEQKLSRKQSYEYFESMDSLIRSFRDSLKSECETATTNQYLQSVCGFLWFCERDANDQLCKGMIGITDTDKSVSKYPVSVDPPRQKNSQYKIPLLEREIIGKRKRQRTRAIDVAWDQAYDTAVAGESELDARDFLMIRIIRETGLRRIALRHLLVKEFEVELGDGELRAGEKYVYVEIEKNAKGHFQKFTIDLFMDIADYVRQVRPALLVKGDNANPYLFNGQKQAEPITARQVNDRLAKHGIAPHQGRSIHLTEMFVELLREGYAEKDAIHIVAQQANHSLRNDGSTLRKHYLEAQMILKGTNFISPGQYRAEEAKLKKRIAELESLLGEKR